MEPRRRRAARRPRPWAVAARAATVRGPPGGRPSRVARPAIDVNEDEYIEVWDQTTMELALDLRELLITDGNLFFIGPDVESYADNIAEVTDLINYTLNDFQHESWDTCAPWTGSVEQTFTVPPLASVQKWPWSLLHHGLTFWIDPDGHDHRDAAEVDRIRKLKFPKRKSPFGPDAPANFLEPNLDPPGDPIDMWNEADVHVDLRNLEKAGGSVTNLIMASAINYILDNPPKWRGWFKNAKIKGTIPADYMTPLQERRAFPSNGVSPRLNRLLNA